MSLLTFLIRLFWRADVCDFSHFVYRCFTFCNVVSLYMKVVSLFMKNFHFILTKWLLRWVCLSFVCLRVFVHTSLFYLYIQVSFTIAMSLFVMCLFESFCTYRSLLLVYIFLFYVTCQSSRALMFQICFTLYRVVSLYMNLFHFI